MNEKYSEIEVSNQDESVDAFDYLAIGNSITCHDICDYWFDEYGMAASEPEKDYVHLVTSWLKQHYERVQTKTTSLYMWEAQHTDRAETLAFLDNMLNEQLNLISVQLGENAVEISTFETDLTYLLEYLRNKAPNAQIVLIDDFWYMEGRTESKRTVSQLTEIDFVDLSKIRYDPAYECGLGAQVVGKDGMAHTVNHEGVAIHPGDAGMKFISDGIISCLKTK